jgi:large subunit ribosomal protein L22
VIGKCLASAVANAEHNDAIAADELFVSACYADEGPTLKRWRPRARGRATRIRKRTCHITVIVSRVPDEILERRRSAQAAAPGSRAARRSGQQAAEARRQRVLRSRRAEQKAEDRAAAEAEHDHEHDHDHDHDDATEGDEPVSQQPQQPEPAEGAPESVPVEGAETAEATTGGDDDSRPVQQQPAEGGADQGVEPSADDEDKA